jgi:hypothetical protein
MSLELEELLPEVAALLGVPLEEVSSACRGEAPAATLDDIEDVSALVQHSLCRLIGMEVEVP